MRRVTGLLLALALGLGVGSVIGGIVTGTEQYWIALVVGVPVLVTLASVLGASASARRPRPLPAPGPVLNPSAGVVLNGEPVAGAAAADRPRVPARRRLLGIAAVLAGVVLALLPSAQLIAWAAGDLVAGRPFDGRDMTVGLHQQEAFDALAQRIGGTEVVEIAFFPRFIDVSAPTQPGARTVDRFHWQAGYTSNVGPDYSQPSDLGQALFDAGDLDLSVVADVTRRSIADAALQGLDGVYPRIARSGEDGEPRITVALTGAYFEAVYFYTVDGTLIERTGSAFAGG